MNHFILKRRPNNFNQRENNKAIDYPIRLIFNDLSDRLTHKDIIKILLFSILLLSIDISKAIMNKIYEKSEEFITFEYYYCFQLFFLFIFSIIFYHKKFYKHQYFSIIALLISHLALLSIQYKSFKVETLYYSLFQIVVSIFDSIFIIYIKELMEYKFLSPYRTLYIFGIINFILLLIIYFIVSFIKCNYYFCYLNFNNNNYFDNIFSVFDKLDINIILLMLFSSILFGLLSLFNYIIINNYTVCHLSLFTQNGNIITLFNMNNKKNGLNDSIFIYAVNLIINVLELIFILILVEIIQLNCCGLNKNTKKNIMKREAEDRALINDEINNSIEEIIDNSDKNEGMNN